MQLYAHIIEVKESALEEYKRLHANVWPEVLKQIKDSGIQNYSIYLRQMPDARYYLFSYFEYVGADFDASMQAMAADPNTQEWWAICKPCQKPLPGVSEDAWWADTEEVFHCD